MTIRAWGWALAGGLAAFSAAIAAVLCVNHAGSNDNAATGPVIVGDEVLAWDPVAAPSLAQTKLPFYELSADGTLCATLRPLYNAQRKKWSPARTSVQVYSTPCFPALGVTRTFAVRAGNNYDPNLPVGYSAWSAPVSFVGQAYACFESTADGHGCTRPCPGAATREYVTKFRACL